MTDPRERRSLPHDDELGELYRRLPADEPRAEIDRAILEAGHRAAARPRNVLRRLRWAAPLAAAAGVVLTLTLARVADRTPEPLSVGGTASERQDDVASEDAFATKLPKRERDEELARDSAPPGPAPHRSAEKRDDAAAPPPPAAQPAAPSHPGMPPAATAGSQDSVARPRAAEPRADLRAGTAAKQAPAARAPSIAAGRAAEPLPEAKSEPGESAAPAPPPPAPAAHDSMAATAAPEAVQPSAEPAPAAPCMQDGAPPVPDPVPPEVCPFQFRVGVPGAAVCETLSSHLRRPCRVEGERIDMRLDPPVALADGSPVERLVVELEAGQSVRMRMHLAGGGERVCPSGK